MNIFSKILAIGAIGSMSLVSAPIASADIEPNLGDIMLVGFNFCPRGWAAADGQLLPISQNQALYSLYGTTYGGDGRTSFALPDMRSRAPIHVGHGPGLSSRNLGSHGGSETNVITTTELPSHTHRAGVQTRPEAANSTTPRKNSFAVSPDNRYYDGLSPQGKFMNSQSITMDPEGGGQAQNNMMPYQTINYCVALQGTFPSRN